jgi:putative exporter of polyketide antibiotics
MKKVADKFTKDGRLWITVFRKDDGTAHIVRTDAAASSPALEWDSDRTPEEWIAMNGPRSQDRWVWTQGEIEL